MQVQLLAWIRTWGLCRWQALAKPLCGGWGFRCLFGTSSGLSGLPTILPGNPGPALTARLREGQGSVLHKGRGGNGRACLSLQPPKLLLLLNPEEDIHSSFLWDTDLTCLTFTGNHFSYLFQLFEELLPGTLYGPLARRCNPLLHTHTLLCFCGYDFTCCAPSLSHV